MHNVTQSVWQGPTKISRIILLSYFKISIQSIGDKFLSKDDAIDLAIHFSSQHQKANSAGPHDVNQNV